MELKSEEKMADNQFIYLVTLQHAWRFNVRTSHCCLHQLIKDFSDCSIPIGMGGVVVNSKLYMFGGEKLKEGSDMVQVYIPGFISAPMQVEGLNVDVFELDATNIQVPLVPVRGDDSIPRMNAPKICPIVATIGDRIYVLSSRNVSMYDYSYELPPRSVFEAYDPSKKLWMKLDPPPFYEKLGGSFFTAHFVWGNRLFLRTRFGHFFFDVKDNIWHSSKDNFIKQFCYPVFPPSGRLVAFKNFLIGVDFYPRHHPVPVFAYRFDRSDVLSYKSYTPLHAFSKVVDPPLYDCSGHINHLGDGDDGRMTLLLSGFKSCSHKQKNWIVRIATFQVQVSQQSADADDDDDEVLSVLVDDPVHFNLGVMDFDIALDHESVFVLCEESKKRSAENVEGDQRLKKEKYSVIE
ncbi:hypothetical protein CKAN_02394400 [Cinnamomum micranthum f. kanehirae]|uniref:Uncharacterized protein n=1 Tax=Cinnamomum micranthum f. kanehirae TaxID=337451 RepID=A0A3S3P6L2_9MAGN|nr:hypothetical protein CKAN_02394400 [Cinnamomum micranthum f. kanehirae]